MNDKVSNFNMNIENDPAQAQLEQAKGQFLLNRKLDHIQGVLREFDLSDIITVLGESDVLECIGVKRQLDYIQHIGFGPTCEDKRFVRERVSELANSFECDGWNQKVEALERLVDTLHISEEEAVDNRERVQDIKVALGRR